MTDHVSRIKVRPAHAADGPAIEQLHRESVRRLAVSYYSPAQVETFLACGLLDRKLIEAGTYYVAELGDTLVGSGGWMPVEQGPGGPWRARNPGALRPSQLDALRDRSPTGDSRRDRSRAGRLHDLRGRGFASGRAAIPEPRLSRGRALWLRHPERRHLAGRADGEGPRQRNGVVRVSESSAASPACSAASASTSRT
jgi:hypothetical protein